MPQPKRATRTEAMRSAVEETLAAAAGQAQSTRGRAQDLVDELATTAGRLRSALDELRPATGEEIRALADRLDELGARVAKIERKLRTKGG